MALDSKRTERKTENQVTVEQRTLPCLTCCLAGSSSIPESFSGLVLSSFPTAGACGTEPAPESSRLSLLS